MALVRRRFWQRPECFALGVLALEGQMICNETIGVENHLIPISRSFPAVLAPLPKGFYAFSFFLDQKTKCSGVAGEHKLQIPSNRVFACQFVPGRHIVA